MCGNSAIFHDQIVSAKTIGLVDLRNNGARVI